MPYTARMAKPLAPIGQLASRLTLSCIVAFGAGMLLTVLLAFNSTAAPVGNAGYDFAVMVGASSPVVALGSLVVGGIACVLKSRQLIGICTVAPWVCFFGSIALSAAFQ